MEEKWTFLQEIASTTYSDLEETDQWLLKQCHQLLGLSAYPGEKKLLGFLHVLMSSPYSQTTERVARHFVFGTEPPHLASVKGAASAVLVHRYTFLQERDSLEKYLAVLGEYLASDSSHALLGIYYAGKGSLAEYKGDFFEAVVNYNAAFQVVDSADISNLFVLHHDIAAMYLNMNFDEKATFHAEKALALVGKENIPAECFNTLSVIQSRSGRFKDAEELLARAVDYGVANQLSGLLAQSYSNLGNLRRKQRKFEEALAMMEISDSLCRQSGIGIGLLMNQVNRAELYLDKAEYDRALQVLDDAFPALLEFNLPHVFVEYYKLRYGIYDAQGNQALADRYFRQYVRYQEAYLGDLPRSVISEWERTTEREKMTKEAAALALSLEREVKNKYLVAFISTVFLLIFCFLYLMVSRKRLMEKEKARRMQQQLKYELELKSKELLNDSLNSIHIQQTKERILEKLGEILSGIPAKDRHRFDVLIKQLRTGSEADFLAEFEKRFTGVHEAFTQKLLEIAPDLTPNELRMCAFIRLNITSKDIARLTNRSVGTIDNTRSMLRRKLKLNGDENLQQFLIGL